MGLNIKNAEVEQLASDTEREVWPFIPPSLAGRGVTRGEEDEILGYGPEGV